MHEGALDLHDVALVADDIALDRELSARSLREYVELAWPEVEPSQPFSPNWHIDAICDVLEAVKARAIDRLVINVPPGVGKSLVASVLFPSWLWTDWPGCKVISASFESKLAERDAVRSRTLYESDWWRARWGHQMQPNNKQWTASEYWNKQGGMRKSVGSQGGVTGAHAHIQIADDPHKPQEITGSMESSRTSLERTRVWWAETMATRLVDRATGVRIIIMQRLHEGDLTGLMLEAGGYHHLCLPMEYEPKFASMPTAAQPKNQPCPIKKCKASHNLAADPRTESGELLDPVRSPAAAVASQRVELTTRGAAAQHDQMPAPAEGAVFKRSQIRHCRQADLPGRFQKMIQSWDMTFKKTEAGSYVVGQVWGQTRADCYLIDQVRGRWGMSDTCKAVRALSLKHPKAHVKLVEAKANGNAVVDMLKKDITGFRLVEPDGGKEARANSVEPIFEGGNVWLPHPDETDWIEGWVDELLGFPAVKNDDQVDSMTQALHYLRRGNLNRLRAAMANT